MFSGRFGTGPEPADEEMDRKRFSTEGEQCEEWEQEQLMSPTVGFPDEESPEWERLSLLTRLDEDGVSACPDTWDEDTDPPVRSKANKAACVIL